MPYRDDLAALEVRRAGLERERNELRATARATASRLADCEAELSTTRAVLAYRRRPLPSLDEAKIASPCRARWDDMAGDERVRFCAGCSKNVYNLSAMSRAEAEALLREGGDLCARLYRREDGTVLTADCPIGVRRRRVRAVAVTAFAGTTLAAGVAAAMAPLTREIRTVSVGEVAAGAASLEGRRVRLRGTLVHGSLAKRESPCEYRFRLSGDGVEVPVRHAQCVVPDTFRDTPGVDLEVLAEGRLRADGYFAAASVMARGGRMGAVFAPSPRASALEPTRIDEEPNSE
jgi:cytochrome c-type biogenesis protein CcmE